MQRPARACTFYSGATTAVRSGALSCRPSGSKMIYVTRRGKDVARSFAFLPPAMQLVVSSLQELPIDSFTYGTQRLAAFLNARLRCLW